MHKKFFSIMYGINIVAQSVFSLITPVLILFALSWVIISKLGAPEWIYAISITVGVIIGLVSMIKFVIVASENLNRLENQVKNTDKTGQNTNEE